MLQLRHGDRVYSYDSDGASRRGLPLAFSLERGNNPKNDCCNRARVTTVVFRVVTTVVFRMVILLYISYFPHFSVQSPCQQPKDVAKAG